MTKGLITTLFTGRNLIETGSTASTNNYAVELLANSEPIEGTAIMAAYQADGRGQRGSSWYSESGKNLLVSFIFYPSFLPAEKNFLLNIITSNAVAATIEKFINETVKIKWPNDIYVNDSKIAGILIENSLRGTTIKSTVIGIGLNVNQLNFPDFPVSATSVAKINGSEVDVPVVFNTLCNLLEKNYLILKAGGEEKIVSDYLQRLYRKDEWHLYESAGNTFTGKLTGIDKYGKLMITSQENEALTFDLKEIRFLP